MITDQKQLGCRPLGHGLWAVKRVLGHVLPDCFLAKPNSESLAYLWYTENYVLLLIKPINTLPLKRQLFEFTTEVNLHLISTSPW